jgi:hypothetical protein
MVDRCLVYVLDVDLNGVTSHFVCTVQYVHMYFLYVLLRTGGRLRSSVLQCQEEKQKGVAALFIFLSGVRDPPSLVR